MLIQRHERAVYHLVWRMVRSDEDARDLTQEIFLKVFRVLEQFDQERNFTSWLFKIASNQTIDFLRRRKLKTVSLGHDPEDEDRPPLEIADPGPRPDDDLVEHRRREMLALLVDRLAPHYRIVVQLRYERQLSYEEIRDILGLPLGTVKARLHRAHQQLKTWLSGGDDVPFDSGEAVQ
ncbi:MAG: sigma-70 family RNA polymerase sigma factor [Candidatus Eisenbacteria bacterium]|nr:sigma-70 family RNA polymerase sigma factor [Candidatus Eisenbacteria bacterium]MCC7143622.1 sigma-70 family RNA polymerase sigma factor [Candidatus Eisenbacteria bacterium]